MQPEQARITKVLDSGPAWLDECGFRGFSTPGIKGYMFQTNSRYSPGIRKKAGLHIEETATWLSFSNAF
jgi:hypothetical protein